MPYFNRTLEWAPPRLLRLPASKRAVWTNCSARYVSILHVTPSVTLRGMPAATHECAVKGRSPLEWAVDRLRIRQDKESGIVNDPNAWFADDPAELVAHLQRLVYLGVETTRIVERLPPALVD